MKLLIGLLLALSSCTPPPEPKNNFYFREFFELNSKAKYIGSVSILRINNLNSNGKFINTLSLDFALENSFYESAEFKKYSAKTLTCKPGQMYGYWKPQGFDVPMDVKTKDNLLVYLSFSKEECIISFISKINDKTINYLLNDRLKKIDVTTFNESLKEWIKNDK